ncbi:hypothetical protein PDE_08088 [Penicillium oxalicum 114-2]|uniref:HTH APSES-type domain-containing protein n=1 Tax=Penicillium oxalicum (strain 114-2 / CGMCC 5302) TaxID=933388 RepID=S7ZWH4_PENO1|nr:hypothetical protein PDE_08088 [Penicillium oxalicum 114-2]
MSSIQDLLNPKPKTSKDSAVFRPGPIQGELRYPPCEDRTPFLEEEHRKANLTPFGNIADFPRHIPYSSEKKTFWEKTGRDSFNVFQYTFQRNGEDKPWTVTWDYNIGLVRMTHLFKCLNHQKTTPGKVLNSNHGLRDISHSITGGSLAAQGYWMPFKAAKALAATFCWDIRFLLTPVFGLDFPGICVSPTDHLNYKRMIIDPAIVREAAEEARRYRLLEQRPDREESTASYPLVPRDLKRVRDTYTPDSWEYSSVSSKVARYRYDDSVGSVRGSSTEPYLGSPQSPPPRQGFTPINRAPDSFDARHQSSFQHRASLARYPDDTEPEIGEDLLTSSEDESLVEGDREHRGSRQHPSPGNSEAPRNPSEASQYSSHTHQVGQSDRAMPRSVQFGRLVTAAQALLEMHMTGASPKGSDGEGSAGGSPTEDDSEHSGPRRRRYSI